MSRKKLLEGVEDAGVGDDDRGVDLNFPLSLQHRHT